MTFEQFKVSFNEYILTNFGDLLKKSEAEEEAVIAKHLNVETTEAYDLSINREIKLSVSGITRFGRRNCLLLSIISWWLPPYTATELQESLRTIFYRQEYFDMYSYIHDKELCLYKLFREDDYTHSDLFGNILQMKMKRGITDSSGTKRTILRSRHIYVYIKLINKKTPRATVYRRGYNDHGSLPDRSQVARRKAVRETYTYDEELKIEQRLTSNRLRIENKIIGDLLRLYLDEEGPG